MSKNYGWITLNRQITSHWIWNCEPYSKAQAWLDLLLYANHTDTKIIIKGVLIELKRGQQARSQVTLSEQWKWSRDKVKRFIKTLENDGMISQQTSQLTSIITICNYSSFQDIKDKTSQHISQQASQQASQHSSSRQVTVNNDNNENPINNEKGQPKEVAKATRSQFIKPTPIELENYFLEKGLSFEDAKKESIIFYSYYESKGWVVGKSQMKSWKASVTGWIARQQTKPEIDINSRGWSQ